MLIIRIILLTILALFLMLIFAVSYKNSEFLNDASPMVILFIVLMVILGPLWPTKNKLEKLNDKFSLPTDSPKIAYPVFMALSSLACFYLGIKEYIEPGNSHRRIAGLAYSLFGTDGVIVLWTLLGIFCFSFAYHGYVKYKTA